ncbi:uncharacterized protein LOC131246548 isoform X5 [Magnolia sinica]|uniref:uncharacterized protein LOC131246548 isoform X5 n=1 Tax=Magnolia sinica TaxID=86752 RepID=UPI002658C182|nr:uncharacterized protein LOC131246548 isoform X5 [Magnolia sinica]XP_058102780.1 uncharacterized protein LOC131246548 isoform X5 [Magnolia sinica]XP_058102781.1 uncharacterized protein LOC131246548 isoform X5 [Magnolia sinica]
MGKTVAVCQVGGKFLMNNDGSMSYTGGEAHAIPVVPDMKFDEFKSEIAEMCNRDMSTLSIKYFLPSNRRTLITISNDKNMQRMIDFHEDSATIDVFVLDGEVVAQNALKTVNNRARKAASGTKRRTTATDPIIPTAATIYTISGDRTARTLSVNPITPIATIITAFGNDKGPGLSSSTDNLIMGVGQEFNSAHDFRDALRMYAISKGFIFVYMKNENTRVTAKCKAAACPWRVHASRLSTVQKFKIKTINNVHTCGGGVGKNGHPHASRRWVASIIRDKIRDKPDYKPAEIVNDIYREYGVNLKYHQAWRGKEIAQEQLQDSCAEAYNQLPWLCERIRETNPGSHVTLIMTDESRFHRLFISFHASQHGFENGCRPLILLDGRSLRDKCQGTLLAAASVDGDDAIFPIAFAIVDSESYNSWHWFLDELKLAVSTNRTITFVSNTRNGLEEAVPQVFKDSYHAYSLHHLTEDFERVLVGPSQMVKDALVDEFKQAAYSCSINDFNACIESIQNASHDAATWVLESKHEHWSNAFFRGSRYNHVSSNIAELFFGWISDERELSIIQTVDMIRCKIMEIIYTRREASSSWSTILTPSMEQRLEMEISNSSLLSVLLSSGSVFEVQDDTVNIVDIETWSCSCQRWKISGLPCIHAAAVFNHTGRNMYDYCSRFFTVDCYRLTYLESIYPIPDIGKPVNKDSNSQMIVHPPHIHRPHRLRGRPKKKWTESLDPSKKLRLQNCSRCGGSGHNKLRCRELKQ